MPNYFTKIDETTIEDHARLVPADEILYLFEYVSGRDYSFGSTNSMISNLKKKPSLKGSTQYKYKLRDMRACSAFLKDAINPAWLNGATLVPVPPSKAPDHPEYDDRIARICRDIPVDFDVDVRELVTQTTSTDAAHESSNRPSVEDLLEIYQINEGLAAPAPRRIAIVDDVLTAGTHYRAMHTILRERFPTVAIVGMFVARRIFPQIDPAEEFSDLV